MIKEKMTREERIIAAINLEPYDRVPVAPLLLNNEYPFRYKGRNSADAFDPIPAGYRRTFILKTDSFCKDMDLYSAYPDTVEPLPFHSMGNYPYGPDEKYQDDQKRQQYRQQFNTRRVGGQKN